MSFHDKQFWVSKGGGHLTDGETVFDNSSRIEPKRSHQWFANAAEQELFPNKKQAVQAPNSASASGIPTSSISWETASNLQSVPNQFVDRLFGSETTRPVNFTERNFSEQFGSDSSVALSMSYTVEDPETCISYGGIRKVKINQVKDSDNGMQASKEHNANMFMNEAYDRGHESSFVTMQQTYSKDDSVALIGHTYNTESANMRSMVSAFGKSNDNGMSFGHSYNKGDANSISFGGFHEESDIDALATPVNSYNLLYNKSPVQTSETPGKKELDVSNANAVVSASQVAKSRPELASKNKSESKSARKEAPNSFPSNVRSLIATGILDGVPVKYVTLSREELCGVIKGSGYLCGCQSCDYSKALNAYEFERHAGCKTKHPNNHIYFENGKTIYQIVQELKSTPESLLFDAIQTVTGSPINQKAF
ncbi:unnamed protein product [Ilex paraguariensis]|uniref:Tify domain-containing protein n=1 Tax=Ilex paraguariensis TaxID=185542 RepID=A0ABC8RB82_9AQUA